MGHATRYSRQVLFPPIGEAGQSRLERSSVAILGCGALGTHQANLLARAGVGRLRIIDRDYVEESNLQRQVLFDESDAAQRLPKSIAAQQKLKMINADVEVEAVVEDLQAANAERLLSGFDVILDGADNFEARFLVNDAAVKLNIPWIYGAVVASYGVTLTVLPGRTACLSCLMPQIPSGLHETCDTAGIIAPAASWVTSIQVTEALKVLLGRWDDLHGKLLTYDIWRNRRSEAAPERDPNCRTCARRQFVYLDAETPTHMTLCGRDAVQVRPNRSRQIDLDALKERLSPLGAVRGNGYLVQFSAEGREITVFPDGRAIIKGTEDPASARSLYARYIGA